jgi:thiosulfate/3-mercaptopyruvate sulfurtransferase
LDDPEAFSQATGAIWPANEAPFLFERIRIPAAGIASLFGLTMVTFVSADWVEKRLDSPDFLIIDPRSVIRYMSAHAKNSVSLPAVKVFTSNGLRPVEELARWIGAAGLDDTKTPVLYDNSDGRNAALLAWLLLYLGRTDVHIMETFWEKWLADGREAFYRPVQPASRTFTPRVRSDFRVSLAEVQNSIGRKLVDFRSRDEFTGKLDTDDKPGHIPGAVNLAWQELNGPNQEILAPREKLLSLFADCGISADDQVVAYCRTGMRAALGFLALAQLGIPVSLYDGSYAEWARNGMPVEHSEVPAQT